MITRLGLTETEPLHGTTLLDPTSNEMSGSELIRLRSQASASILNLRG